MIIALSCNENWYKYLVVNIYSLLKCTKNVKKLYLLLETDKIDDVPDLDKVIAKYPVEIEPIRYAAIAVINNSKILK